MIPLNWKHTSVDDKAFFVFYALFAGFGITLAIYSIYKTLEPIL